MMTSQNAKREGGIRIFMIGKKSIHEGKKKQPIRSPGWTKCKKNKYIYIYINNNNFP